MAQVQAPAAQAPQAAAAHAVQAPAAQAPQAAAAPAVPAGPAAQQFRLPRIHEFNIADYLKVHCQMCQEEVFFGTRFQCEQCPTFFANACQECVPKLREHHDRQCPGHTFKELCAIPIKEPPVQKIMRRAKLLNMQRDRQSVQLMVHASSCTSPLAPCPSNYGDSCCRMKMALAHYPLRRCNRRGSFGRCDGCQKMWELLTLHAKSCKLPHCPVPKCNNMRERVQARRIAESKAQMTEPWQLPLCP